LETSSEGCRINGIEVRFADVGEPADEKGAFVLPGTKQVQTSEPIRFQFPATPSLDPLWHFETNSPISALSARDGVIAIGLVDGTVHSFSKAGQVPVTGRTPSPVRAIQLLPDGGVAAGGEDGTLSVFEPNGQVRWTTTLEWKPMSWEYWTRFRCEIVSLTTAGLEKDEEALLIAGCADRHLYAFDKAGKILWRTPCKWGVPTCLDGARSRDGSTRILAGMSRPSIHGWCRVHDEKGAFTHVLTRPDIEAWSIPSHMRALRAFDLDGDGDDEVITGLDTNHRQLIVYRLDGERLWDADLGATVSALHISATGNVVAGCDAGGVSTFDRRGKRLWHTFLIHRVVGLAGSSEVTWVALEKGTVVALSPEGEIIRRSSFQKESRPPSAVLSCSLGRDFLVAHSTTLALYGLPEG
jgi:outer membrane protein assembly factor BamB